MSGEQAAGQQTQAPVTLITGATKGLGLAFAHSFAARGHDLMIVARSGEDLARAARDLEAQHGVRVYTLRCDLSSIRGRDAVERDVKRRRLFVEYLVNNAGYGLAGPFIGIDREQTLNMIDLNVGALTDLTRRFLPAMVEARRGGVLNVSSLAGMTPGPYQAAYYATKAYVNSLSEALAHEVWTSGVKVAAFLSGPVETEFHSRMGADTAHYIRLLGMQKPELAAEAAVRKFLAGRRIIVHGAMNMISALFMRITPHFILVPCVAWLLKLRGPRKAAD
ncbi:MAG: SDR family NAD(P)-dependent oxidoreductase [Methyloligellaceae bacterium]